MSARREEPATEPLKRGEAVRLTAREGVLRSGATGVVLHWFRHSDGDLALVKFGKATRVVHSAKIEATTRRRA